ncbi:VC0807 family protein [Caulobacter segnis]
MSAEAVAAKAPRPAGLGSLGRSLLINGLGPYLVYSLAAPRFPPSSTMPLLLSIMVPAADLAVGFARRRGVDVIALIALTQLLVSAAISLLAHSVSGALVGHALQPAALGLVFGLSALFGRPLIAPLARQTVAGDDLERQARFDAKASLAGVRRTFIRITLAWAVALCAESVFLVVAIRMIATQDYLLMSSVTNVAVLTLLTWGSLRYGLLRAAALGGAPDGESLDEPRALF